MKFSIAQFEKFKSSRGSYSVVTPREIEDSQITLTDFEAQLVTSFFGLERIHKGSVESNPALSAKPFFLYPGGKEIWLNLVFPKPGKKELRLYLSKKAGFKPAAGVIWFLFIKDNKVWIGSQSIATWRSDAVEIWEDEYEYLYQREIDEQVGAKIHRLRERDVHARDRKIGLKRLELAKYTCEYDPNHKLFISRYSNRPHLEVHHLIPMKAQPHFAKSLDTLGNVCCLCPWCHNAVHYAEEKLSAKILSKLIAGLPVLKIYSLDDANDILGLYGVEKIHR